MGKFKTGRCIRNADPGGTKVCCLLTGKLNPLMYIVIGTFESDVYCEPSGERCIAVFTVVESYRICIDIRANEAIESERHPIPTIEEVLHDLNGSTVFR